MKKCPQGGRDDYVASIALTPAALAHLAARVTGQAGLALTPNQVGHMLWNAGGVADPTAPCCPEHHIGMVKLAMPAEFSQAGQTVWVCPGYGQCQHWWFT